MTSHITYNGVASVEGGVKIFRDIHFWVALRVPTRNSIIDYIQNNGGVVVPLEKNADICIADHLRKDAPPGSYSYEFVIDSVRNGIIQLKDRYRIGPDPSMPKPIRTGAQARSFRTPFTPEDDAALAKWILEHGHEAGRGGNYIYMQLEKENGRHTWQSWRNRYVKNLKFKSDKEVRRLAATATATAPETEDEETDGAQNRPPNPGPNKVAEARMNQGRERRATAVADTSNSRPRSSHENRPPRTSAEEDWTAPDERGAFEENNAIKQGVVPKRNGISKENAISRTDTGPDAIPEDNTDVEEDAVTEEGSQMAGIKGRFYSDFHDYMAATDLDLEVHHRIGGKELELWDLFQATGAQKVLPEKLNWIKVADDLGYDGVRIERVVGSLRQCYKDNLAEFVDAMATFSVEDEEEIDEVAQQDEESEGATPQPRAEQASPQSDVASSPPVGVVPRKRRLDTQAPSSGHLSKRRRLDRNETIASTPDEKIGVSRNQTPSPSVRKSMLQDSRIADKATDSAGLPPLARSADESDSEVWFDVVDDEFQMPRPTARLESDDDNPFDITPSQQLSGEEAVNNSPIPLRLATGNTGRNARPASDAPRETAARRMHMDAQAAAGTTASTRPQARTRTLPASFRRSQAAAPSRQPQPEQQRRREAPREHGSGRGNDEGNRRQISDWMEHYESLGYSRRIVVEALRCTSMTPGGLAGVVMQSLQDGKGVPTHHGGIWTDRDDASLRLVDSADATREAATAEEARRLKKADQERNRLVNKHGLERIELRRRFLEATAEVALDEEATA